MDTIMCWWSQIIILNIVYFTHSLGSLKEAHIFQASSWMSLSYRIFPSSHHQLGVSTTHPIHSTNLSYSSAGVLGDNGFLCLPHIHQPAPGRNALHQAPVQVGAPGQIPGKMVQPLHPATVEGYKWGNGWGYPQVRPCGTSCSTPGTFFSIGHNFRNRYRHLDSLW